MTDVHTGWIHLEVLRNLSRAHMLPVLHHATEVLPVDIQGLDCDNGSEFLNDEVLKWAGERKLFFTRSRAYKKNDQATVESKNNHVVRRYGYHMRYDTDEQRAVLARLREKVMLKMNLLTPTRKPIGWTTTSTGKRRRVYDAPKTPLDRLLDAQVLSSEQQAELTALRDATNPAALARDIYTYQHQLIALAQQHTEDLRIAEAKRKNQCADNLTKGIKITNTPAQSA